jgi:hypothetical protein
MRDLVVVEEGARNLSQSVLKSARSCPFNR